MSASATPSTQDNISLPFQIAEADVRGRVVRLGGVVDEILSAHDYPAPIARLVGDAVALVTLLATALKFDGIFTLQAQSQGDGPLSLLCADYRTGDGVRGYAKLDRAAYDAMVAGLEEAPTLNDLMPKGYLAFTIDRGGDAQRYQGIVELKAEGLAASAEAYFRDSEQIPSYIHLATAELLDEAGHGWRSGGLLVQKMPEARAEEAAVSLQDEDLWPRIGFLTETVQEHELVDPATPANDLLFRLYHEDGVRVFDPIPVQHTCRCSEEKVLHTLGQFGREELQDMLEDGKIVVTCVFCSTTYKIDPENLPNKG